MTASDAPGWLTLAEGERLRWIGRPTLVRVARLIAAALALVILGLVAPAVVPADRWWVAPIAVLAGLVTGVVAAVRHRRVRYVVTTEAVYRRAGLLSREVTIVPLHRVQNTSYSQSPSQRLLGYGDVRLDTAGSGDTELILEAVPDPRHVAGVVGEQLAGDVAHA